jgi:hypothetical protein
MTPALNSKIDRGYRPVNRMANPATTVSTLTASHRNTRTTKWGRRRAHFTSHSQGLSGRSRRPSKRAG